MCSQPGTRREAEQHDADEHGLEEEGRQHLVGEKRPGDVAHGLHEARPVGAELEGHGDARDDAHGEAEREDLHPEPVGRHPLVVARLRKAHAEEEQHPAQRDGDRREQDVERDIGRELDAASETDPDNAAAYAANGEAYKTQIAATFAPIRGAIEALPEERRWLVTSEAAFSYLARDFGLKEASIWAINADSQGSPQQVRRIIDLMRDNDIPVIFSESTVSPKPAEQVARETGAAYGGVLYVDSLSTPDGPVPTYLDLLRVTSETIVKD
jgi:ABC-type Zn2+ transport system substrate-binding protein/surface adhesin